MKALERLFSALAWLQIFAAPATIGAIAGLVLWLVIRGALGVSLAAAAAFIGCGAGMALAEKARRSNGTLEFMSRISAHPELKQENKNDDYTRIK